MKNKVVNQQVWEKLTSIVVRFTLISFVVSLIVLFSVPTASLAIDLPPTLMAALQSAPFEEQPATLISPKEGTPIALYIRPAPNQQPVGYGISGDPVTVTDQFGDYLMEDDPSATWSHIRLNNAPYTEGWLRGRFLSMDNQPTDPNP